MVWGLGCRLGGVGVRGIPVKQKEGHPFFHAQRSLHPIIVLSPVILTVLINKFP